MNSIENDLQTQIQAQVAQYIWHCFRSQCWNQVSYPVWRSIWGQIEREVWSQVRSQVQDFMLDDILAPLRVSIAHYARSELNELHGH